MEEKIKSDGIVIHADRGHIIEINGKFYKLNSEGMDADGRTVTKQYYKEIDPKNYYHELWNLARRLEEEADIRLVDVIVDSLKDLPLEKIASIEDALMKARLEAKKEKNKESREEDRAAVTTVRTGGCIELVIGEEHLVLRE